MIMSHQHDLMYMIIYSIQVVLFLFLFVLVYSHLWKLSFINYICSLLERTAWNLDKKLATFLSILMQNWAASLAILDFSQIELEN
jgi:hypothetical protein